MTMEIETLGFYIYQIHKYACAVRETQLALAEFDQKRLKSLGIRFGQRRRSDIESGCIGGGARGSV